MADYRRGSSPTLAIVEKSDRVSSDSFLGFIGFGSMFVQGLTFAFQQRYRFERKSYVVRKRSNVCVFWRM